MECKNIIQYVKRRAEDTTLKSRLKSKEANTQFHSDNMSSTLKTSYGVQTHFGELYTGGIVASHPIFGVLTPMEDTVHAMDIHHSGRRVLPLQGDGSRVMAIACHPKNFLLAVAFASDMVRIYEPTLKPNLKDEASKRQTYVWKEIKQWKCDLVQYLCWDNHNVGNPLIAACSADGSYVHDKNMDKLCMNIGNDIPGPQIPGKIIPYIHQAGVKVFDQKGGFCTHNFRGHEGPVTVCQFAKHKEEFYLFSAGRDGAIRVWSLVKSKQIHILANHVSHVTQMHVIDNSAHGFRMVSVGRDQILSYWDLDRFKLISTIPCYESLESCIYVPPKTNLPSKVPKTSSKDVLILTGGESGLLKLWNVSSCQCIYEESNRHGKNGIDYLIYDFDTSMFITVTNEQNILLYRYEDLNPYKTIVGYIDEIIDLEFIDEQRVVVCSNTNELKIFHLPNFDCDMFHPPTEQESTPYGHQDTILCLSVSHDKRFVATGAKDNLIFIWDTQLKKCIGLLKGHASSVTDLQFFKKTNRYVVSVSKDNTWKIWDLKDVVEPYEKSSDDSTLSLPLITIQSSFLTSKCHNKDINCVSVAPNDRYFATGSQDRDVRIFEIHSLKERVVKEVGILKGHKRGIWNIAFSPVDQVIATCSSDKTMKLWSLKDYVCLKTFEGHTSSVLNVRFISSGLQLLSSGADSLIKVWNIHNNECVCTLDKHDDKIWALSTFSDGETIISGGADSSVYVWKDRTDQEKEQQREKREKEILAEQNLNNFIRTKQFKKALYLALYLDNKRKIYDVLVEIVKLEDEETVDDIYRHMTTKNIQKMLLYISEWNTNSKYALTSQMALHQILSRYHYQSLLKVEGIKEILKTMIAYTEKHKKRIEKWIQKSYIIDYALDNMQLRPEEDAKRQKTKEDGEAL